MYSDEHYIALLRDRDEMIAELENEIGDLLSRIDLLNDELETCESEIENLKCELRLHERNRLNY
jgi:chromosome segregation ATPase